MAMRNIDWNPILADYQTGQYSISKLAEKHGVSKSTLSERVKGLDRTVRDRAEAVVKSFDDSIEQLIELRTEQPIIAQKVVDIVTQKHPEFKKAMVALSSKLFNRMLKLADSAEANEIPSLAKGMQTITDTLGVSQRHAPKSDVSLVNAQQNVDVAPTQINIIRDN
jgi:transposase-like protein